MSFLECVGRALRRRRFGSLSTASGSERIMLATRNHLIPSLLLRVLTRRP